LDNKKTTATDKDGNTVQYTYHIGCKETQTYTINAYLTKCSLLINGKNVEKFIDDDSGFLIIQPLVISIAEVYIATIYKQFKCYCIQLYTDTPTCK
jgi:hypothetical protein